MLQNVFEHILLLSRLVRLVTKTASAGDSAISRTDLDTHANMAVDGSNSVILADTGKRCQVAPFTPEYEALQEVPIVDAVVLYESLLTGEMHLLLIRNALSVPTMSHNLIPPFLSHARGRNSCT